MLCVVVSCFVDVVVCRWLLLLCVVVVCSCCGCLLSVGLFAFVNYA